jgi:putative holliday junction resolvase
MRILGIDYGSVRIGLALSDELGMLATPFETIDAYKALDRIKQIVLEKQIQTVVLGMPRNMDGSYGPKADEVRKFAEVLKQNLSIQVHFWDERLTTKAVERMLIEADTSRKNRKKVIDKLAAQMILQGYLDAQDAKRD